MKTLLALFLFSAPLFAGNPDLICAKGSDTTIAQLTITGATNAAPPVFTVSASPLTAGYLVGQTFTVVGVSPSAYNATYTVGALDATHITGSGSAPGSAYTSGGTAYMPCNNSSDGTSITNYATTATAPGGLFGTSVTLRADSQLVIYGQSGNTNAFQPGLTYGASQAFSPFTAAAQSPSYGATVPFPVSFDFSVRMYSPAAGTIYSTVSGPLANTFANTLPPLVTSTSSNQTLAPTMTFLKQGVASGTYTSGGSITGTTSQTCTVTSFASMTGTAATVALTGSNTIAGGTALVFTNTGNGGVAVTAPTTATLGNGTATCSGTATISTVLGGAQGMAVRLLSFKTWLQ